MTASAATCRVSAVPTTLTSRRPTIEFRGLKPPCRALRRRRMFPVAVSTSFVNFHRDLLSARELASTERDRGIALCRVGGAAAAAEALPLLQAAVAASQTT